MKITSLFNYPLIVLPVLVIIIFNVNKDAPPSVNPIPVSVNPIDPDTASVVSVDRFSNEAGTLHKRDNNIKLPDANEPINFDELFLFQGFGPRGEIVQYYDFDVMPTKPAPIYVLFREGESKPVEGQLNIIDVLPGDDGYNDFWNIHKIIVPSDYQANTITSMSGIKESGYTIETTNMLVNCPVVPKGSTAKKRYSMQEEKALIRGWYKDQVVYYFSFEESPLSLTVNNLIPVSPIYVSFNINPGEEGGGPISGFRTEEKNNQTHNVVASIPGDNGYSPLWFVSIYDNADFQSVTNLMTLSEAKILAGGVALVNCPIVSVSKM